ncbi:MAG: aldehyde dehydrogenase family protein [Rhodopseudomonas sp.]|uniref:aldehyde dehydrogenase family protein n=1 Tax=Rhodopseudomonas sp. TaxID=1078 RepID=UPI0018231637|nr:aldehyde dehydrogenase family protein [Rhodopseudomonas sp.]NVN87787.1 aldehyde dehydrogenase family protein [Rhodopseudomonas sp.]
MTPQLFLVGDEWIVGEGKPLKSVNSANGRVNCEIGTANAADVGRAVQVAEIAQRRPAWRDMKPHERARLLNRIAQGIGDNAGSLAENHPYRQLSISTPFGGFKTSGIGREKGIGGMRLYQQVKSLYWNRDQRTAACG